MASSSNAATSAQARPTAACRSTLRRAKVHDALHEIEARRPARCARTALEARARLGRIRRPGVAAASALAVLGAGTLRGGRLGCARRRALALLGIEDALAATASRILPHLLEDAHVASAHGIGRRRAARAARSSARAARSPTRSSTRAARVATVRRKLAQAITACGDRSRHQQAKPKSPLHSDGYATAVRGQPVSALVRSGRSARSSSARRPSAARAAPLPAAAYRPA